MLVIVSSAQVTLAGDVRGSKHDLSVTGEGPVKSEGGILCYYCHSIHTNEGLVGQGYSMWNKDLSNLGPYDLYSSGTLDTPLDQPRMKSLACLSCHDGTVAVNVIKNGTIPWTGEESPFLTDRYSDLGTDLSDDHPVSFDYDSEVDSQLKPITDARNAGIKFYGEGQNELECGSCHDPHDPDIRPFLRMSNAASALCYACHDK